MTLHSKPCVRSFPLIRTYDILAAGERYNQSLTMHLLLNASCPLDAFPSRRDGRLSDVDWCPEGQGDVVSEATSDRSRNVFASHIDHDPWIG